MVSGALTGIGRIKHEYKREKKRKTRHTVVLCIYLKRSPQDQKKVHEENEQEKDKEQEE